MLLKKSRISNTSWVKLGDIRKCRLSFISDESWIDNYQITIVPVDLGTGMKLLKSMTLCSALKEGRWTDRRAVISGRDGSWGV
jgi:hypothetical protein